MNPAFFKQIEDIIHTERIDVYRRDGADHTITLARYTLNMALSEALYPSLQFAEIALRNAIHQALTTRCGTDAWYDSPLARLTLWQQLKVTEAKDALKKLRKTSAKALDRFGLIQQEGLNPWIQKLRQHWPHGK